jgi:hypothetical protein
VLVDDESLIRTALSRALSDAGLDLVARPPTEKTPSSWWSTFVRTSS